MRAWMRVETVYYPYTCNTAVSISCAAHRVSSKIGNGKKKNPFSILVLMVGISFAFSSELSV